jgi:pimeloyl-ACP methyl ester carboxylesterase
MASIPNRCRTLCYLPVLWLGITLSCLFSFSHFGAALAAPGETPLLCEWSADDYQDFYSSPPMELLASSPPGEVLRVEHVNTYTPQEVANKTKLPSSLYGAEVYRVLVASQSPPGSPQAVSGLILVPTGIAPAEGFPVFVYGHGTTGIADQCAPSHIPAIFEDLLHWVANGYVVAATDYAGLGTPGLHPYGVGDVAGINMLDSARAALHFCDHTPGAAPPLSNRMILAGHSQGGQSALFAHQLWKSYAPELNVLGTVVFAPAAEFQLLARLMVMRPLSARLAPFSLGMYAYSQYYGAPATLSSWLQAPFDAELPERAESQCVVSLVAWLGVRPKGIFQPQLLANIEENNWQALQPLTDYLALNEPGNYTSEVPVFILQGDLDGLVPDEASTRLSQRMCQHGIPVTHTRYPGEGHFSVVVSGRPDAIQWMGDRLEGLPVADACNGDFDSTPLSNRSLEPIIIHGNAAPQMTGMPVHELFVYAYLSGNWRQIPFQIDEVTEDGDYTAAADSIFDENDEVVFMAKDLGMQAPEGDGLDTGSPTLTGSYEIEVSDPNTPTIKGWAYLVYSTTLEPQLSTDLVSFASLLRRINGQTYSLALPSSTFRTTYLTLGDGQNILDRTKFHLDCQDRPQCPITEANMDSADAYQIVKDGPIRVLDAQRRIAAYGSMVTWTMSYTAPAGLEGNVRISTDFAQAATNSTFYNAAVPEGVTVDGVPDNVPDQPISSWWQLSTATGTLIQLSDLASFGGSVDNYYVDDDSFDLSDTGDHRHYGDAGVFIANPGPTVEYKVTLVMLPDTQPNVGATYARFVESPLIVTTSLHRNVVRVLLQPKLYLPYFSR